MRSLEEKVRQDTKDMDAEAGKAARAKTLVSLHNFMDEDLRNDRRYMPKALDAKDTDVFWCRWPHHVDSAFIRELQLEGKDAKHARGHGKVRIQRQRRPNRIATKLGDEAIHELDLTKEARRLQAQRDRCKNLAATIRNLHNVDCHQNRSLSQDRRQRTVDDIVGNASSDVEEQEFISIVGQDAGNSTPCYAANLLGRKHNLEVKRIATLNFFSPTSA